VGADEGAAAVLGESFGSQERDGGLRTAYVPDTEANRPWSFGCSSS